MSTMREAGAPPVETWPPRACEGQDTNRWFPGAGDTAIWARRTCWSCQARWHCAEYAMPIEDLSGIWGAMSPKERTTLRNKNKKEA